MFSNWLVCKLLKRIGRLLPGRIGEEIEGYSLRAGDVRLTMQKSILVALKHQNRFFGRKNLRILVVGTEACSKFDAYQVGNPGDDVWTLDLEESNICYGIKAGYSAGRHVTGSVTQLEDLFEKEFFDIVLLNGVLGWGVNDLAGQKRAIESIYNVSKDDATLMIGWNVNKSQDPIFSGILEGKYDHSMIPGLDRRMFIPKTTHVFDFFKKV